MEIPNDIFSVYEEAVEALLASNYTAKDAVLYYTKPKKNTSNTLSGPGDQPVDIKLGDIRLRIHNRTRQWLETGGIQFVDGRSQIYGLMSDVPLLKKCTYLTIEGHNFNLVTEPMRHGFGSKYFTAFIDLIK